MIARDEGRRHDETWLVLPWLASGRLSAEERNAADNHVRECADCQRELAVQQRLCGAFTAPDCVVYAAGPSFRKLMARIDADDAGRVHAAADARDASGVDELDAIIGTSATDVDTDAQHATARTLRSGTSQPVTQPRFNRFAMWRPPGLAWAASFLVLFGLTGVIGTAYHWSRPAYSTHTDAAAVTPNVLHIAVDRALTVGDVEEILRTNGARIVEGPGSTGVLGVTPLGVVNGVTSAATANSRLRQLAARLRGDSRVLWVQPLADESAGEAPGAAPVTPEH
jgi:hypothetical protein